MCVRVGASGDEVTEVPIPEYMVEQMEQSRKELIEQLADVDEEIAEMFIMEEEPTNQQIKDAIRRATLALTFNPVLMGSA